MAALEKLVDLLAFGKQTPKPAAGLGLYLSPDTVYLSDTRVDKNGRLIVDHLLRIPIPNDSKTTGTAGTMNTDFLGDPQRIAGPVKAAMAASRWSSNKVRVTLSHHLGLLRYFTMPAIERRFLKSAVPLEAKKSIPIPFEVLAYDYQAALLPADPATKPQLGVLIAVTQKKNISNVISLLDLLGLKLDGLEVAPCSVLRLWQTVDAAKNPAPYLHVHIDGGSVRTMAVDRGVPVFLREVFLPADATVDDLRKIDLRGCLSFVQKQLGVAGLAQLRVSGNISSLEAMKEAFAAETGLEAVLQDIPQMLGVKNGDWGGYAALGASSQSWTPDRPALDLAAVDRVSEEERQSARDILVLAAAAALALAGAGVMKSVSFSLRARELHHYQMTADPGATDAFSGLDANGIDNTLREMQTQLNGVRAVTGTNHPKISEMIRYVIELMPDKVWLDRIICHNPLTGEAAKFSVTLHGRAMDATSGDEQALAFRFKDALLKDSRLAKDFDVSLSLQGQANPAGSSEPASDARSQAARLEDRTQFVLELTAKR